VKKSAMILDNQQMIIDDMTHHPYITYGSAHGIIQDQLGIHKVCVRWI
jgi:hypothetical protein